VNSDESILELLLHFIVRQVESESDGVLDREMFAEVFHVLDPGRLLRSVAGANEDQADPLPLTLAHQLPELKESSDLERVVRVRNELTEGNDFEGAPRPFLIQATHAQVLDGTGRIDSVGSRGTLPEMVNPILGPTRVDHDNIAAATRPGVELPVHLGVRELLEVLDVAVPGVGAVDSVRERVEYIG